MRVGFTGLFRLRNRSFPGASKTEAQLQGECCSPVVSVTVTDSTNWGWTVEGIPMSRIESLRPDASHLYRYLPLELS